MAASSDDSGAGFGSRLAVADSPGWIAPSVEPKAGRGSLLELFSPGLIVSGGWSATWRGGVSASEDGSSEPAGPLFNRLRALVRAPSLASKVRERATPPPTSRP